jgi:shikimate kinase
MMGAGKTQVGRALAARLGVPFVDSDAQVEGHTGHTVREIFERDGEAAFRRLESEALADALAAPVPSVIAAAGGVVLDAGNRDLLRRETVVWLRAAPEVLAARVRSGTHRPLLGDDPLDALRRLDVERVGLYEDVADLVVDVDELPSDDVVARVVELVT